jgi:acetolactate decarboxylase
MNELEFLGALHVDLLRHAGIGTPASPHELFQTSTIEALLGGAFDGDVSLGELLEHGDTGLGTLNGLDGELIIIDGQAFKAELDCTLSRPDPASLTPFAVVVPFGADPVRRPLGRADAATLERRLWSDREPPRVPTAVRIDGQFEIVRVRSVSKQTLPYPPLAEAIEHQHRRELRDVSGTMVGFCFPDALDGIEIVGFHLHFACGQRQHGGHVLDFELRSGTVHVDEAAELHVELPAAVVRPGRGRAVDQTTLRRLERDR